MKKKRRVMDGVGGMGGRGVLGLGSRIVAVQFGGDGEAHLPKRGKDQLSQEGGSDSTH